MPTLTWTDAFVLDLPAMDDTHREFIALLARVETCDDESLPAAWREMLSHTEHHFAQEETWMRESGFHACQCHEIQHKVVLRVMREGQMLVDRGDAVSVREIIATLVAWFPQHADLMDAALAQHLRQAGYAPALTEAA